MGTGYTRQSTYINGDIINSDDTNLEFNQLLAAFSAATGHTHDGTAAEGGLVLQISDATQTDKVEIVTGGAKTTGTHQVTGLITADVGLTATTGNIVATAGSVDATAGAVSAGTTVTAGTGVTATTGNITATAGNVDSTAGSVSAGTTVTAGTGITATTGNVTLTTGNVVLSQAGATVDGRDLTVDGTKLDGIEASATADQIASEVTSTPAGNLIATDVQAALNELDTEKAALAGAAFTGAITTTSTFDGRDVAVDGTKLDTIETSAKDDQTAAEVVSTPAGDLVATDVQAALNELDTEKAALAGDTFTGNVVVSQASPKFRMNETDATADNKLWDIGANAEQLNFRVVNDADTVANNYMTITRTGTTVDTVGFPNGNVTVGGTVDGRDIATDGTKLDGIASGATVGSLINVEIIAATGTFTPTAGTSKYLVYATGAGAGGGGADGTDTSGIQAAGGGGAGGTTWIFYNSTEMGANGAVTIGAGGAGGSTSGSDGLGGGTTTFNPVGTGVTITGNGGFSGQGAVSSINLTVPGGDGGSGTGVGAVIQRGNDGRHAAELGDNGAGSGNHFSGAGGASHWGAGGIGRITFTVGGTGTSHGSGGGGGLNINSTSGRAGGAGADGIAIVYEYA